MIEQLIRQNVESQEDYLLRMANIAHLKSFLTNLESEAESIRKIDLPLWYVGGRDPSYSDRWGLPIWILLREDVDPLVFMWVCEHADRAQFANAHPIYPAFYEEGYLIGNKVTPPKKYLRATYPHQGNGIPRVQFYRDYLSKHLGPICWDTLPERDINNKYICR